MRPARPVPEPIDTATFQLPLYATPRATGFTQPTTDYEEAGIDFNRLHYRHPSATYVMRIAQDGHEVDVLAGDLVVIDAALPPQPGDLVVAQIDDAFLLCRFERQDGDLLLLPERADAPPLVVTAETVPDVLFGVCTYILHRPKRRRR